MSSSQLGNAVPQPSSRIYKGRAWRCFFSSFSGWNPVILLFHLQKTCEHGCCCSQLGEHTAVCGQNSHTPHSWPAVEADKCPLQQGRSRFLSSKDTVFLCLIALQLEIIKEQIRIIWWWPGEEHFTSLPLLCAWRQLYAWSCARAESPLSTAWSNRYLTSIAPTKGATGVKTLRRGPDSFQGLQGPAG